MGTRRAYYVVRTETWPPYGVNVVDGFGREPYRIGCDFAKRSDAVAEIGRRVSESRANGIDAAQVDSYEEACLGIAPTREGGGT